MAENGYCGHCNLQAGSNYVVELTSKNGDEQRFNIVLCEECAKAINTEDWATVDASPTESI